MSSGGFLATHVAPPDGLQAWDAPDPSRPVVAQVQPGVRMQLMEQRGAWGHVLFSNGWSGWVDARRLVLARQPASPFGPQAAPQSAPPFRPEPPPQARPPAQPAEVAQPEQPARQAQPQPAQPVARAQEPDAFQLPPQNRPEAASPFADVDTNVWAAQASETSLTAERPQPEPKAEATPARSSGTGGGLSLDNFKLSPAPIGVVAVLVGALLPWISITGFSGNAFRVPMKFLIDYKTQGSGLKVGLLLVAAAVVAGVFSLFPGRVLLRRVMGGVIILIAVVYAIQLQRVLSAGGDAAPSLFSAIGKLGLLFTIAGGVALVIDTTAPSDGT